MIKEVLAVEIVAGTSLRLVESSATSTVFIHINDRYLARLHKDSKKVFFRVVPDRPIYDKERKNIDLVYIDPDRGYCRRTLLYLCKSPGEKAVFDYREGVLPSTLGATLPEIKAALEKIAAKINEVNNGTR